MNQSEKQSEVSTLEELVSTREAAKVLGVSSDHVGRPCRIGSLECRTFSGAWHVVPASITRFARERERKLADRARDLSEERRREYHAHRMNASSPRPPGSGFITTPFLVLGAVLLTVSAVAFVSAGAIAERSASNQETHEAPASSDDPQVASAAATLEEATSTAWHYVPPVGSSESAALALATEEPSDLPAVAVAKEGNEAHQSEPAASDPPQPAVTNVANTAQLQVNASWLTEQLNNLRSDLFASMSQMTTPAFTFSGPP